MQNAFIRLYNTEKKLLSISSPDKIFDILVSLARSLIDAEYGSIYLWQKKSFKRVYTNVPVDELITQRQQGFARIVLESKEPCIIPREEILRFNPQLSKTNIKARIYIPLLFNNFSIGVLTLRIYKKKKVTANEIKLLKIFSSFATLIIERLLLSQEMQHVKSTNETLVNYAAHELRTPLTSMNIYIDLLNKKRHISRTYQRKIVTHLTIASKKLAKVADKLIIINDSINTTSINNFKKINIYSVIKNSIKDFSINYPKRKIIFQKKHSIIFSVKGDKDKLKKGFFTILQYMQKQIPINNKIIVTCMYENPYYVISFKENNKINIVDEKNILKNKSDNSGLFLSRKIIEQHRGFLTVSIDAFKNTYVSVYIPKLL